MMETELLRLWNLVSEITEQLNQNKLATERLQNHAGLLHEQAGHATDGVTLRRFNTDLSKEVLTSELERLSVALVMENQSLLHENKQLSSLLQDYEKTLQTVVEKFRGHSHAAQTHQLTLNRHYETLLAQERTDDMSLTRATDAEHFANLTTSISRALRSMEGKDPLPEEDSEEDPQDPDEEPQEEEEDNGDHEVWQGLGDWAEEREAEIHRLERENAELRHMLGISQTQGQEMGLEDIDPVPFPSSPMQRRSFTFPVADSGPRSFGDDRSRTGGSGPATLGVVGEQKRPGLLGRSGFDVDMGPGVPSLERVPSPPNEIRWEPEASGGPATDSI